MICKKHVINCMVVHGTVTSLIPLIQSVAVGSNKYIINFNFKLLEPNATPCIDLLSTFNSNIIKGNKMFLILKF